jgi:predicted 3-demethylubiquinone-9 3-methyltransferase (glyoxalase superfamily)
MSTIQKITPMLWFDGAAEEAARFYVSVFNDASIGRISRYGPGAPLPEGTVLTVEFTLEGQRFTALNGGPEFSFSPAISFVVGCETQEEVDHFWDGLSEGGPPEAQQCGWLQDRFGVSWQVVPDALPRFLTDPDPARSRRTFEAMLRMKKLDIEALRRAHDGEEGS